MDDNKSHFIETMTSTDMNLGLTAATRPSSRVLKPPGGGHSDIFAPPEMKVHPPRPKYDQQNSSNLNCVMNTTDPNLLVGKACEPEPVVNEPEPAVSPTTTEKKETNGHHENNNKHDSSGGGDSNASASSRGRVPPGGFSSGFW